MKSQPAKKLLYLGEEYTVKPEHVTKIFIQHSFLYFPQALLFRFHKELENWYKQQASTYITTRVAWYAARMHVKYLSVSIADTKSRWGACSHDNRLQFNWRLIMTPHAVLDSVVVHELAHTLEKNHSTKFWIHVHKVMPGYTAHRQWLNHHGDKLFF